MKLPKFPPAARPQNVPAEDVRQNRRRALQNGGYASLLAAALLAALILLNLVAGALPTRYTEFDISLSGMFTLTETTRTLMDSLDRDVTAYYLGITGEEDTNVTRLLDRYADASPHFRWQQRDPNLYPTFAQQYGAQSAGVGSVILTCEDRSEVVSYTSMYPNLDAYYLYGAGEPTFDAENALTTGIANVLRTEAWPLYQLTGHGEATLGADFVTTLENVGIRVQDLNLATVGAVPEDAALLLVGAPQVDYSPENIAVLRDWLADGGRLLVCTDAYIDTPNLDGLLADYGLTRQAGLLIEGDPEHYAYNNPPTYLLMQPDYAEATAGMTGNMYVFAPDAHGILTDPESDYTVTPLLSTTELSYSLVDFLTAEQILQGPDDPAGPFDVAVAVESAENETRLVWVGCPYVLDSSADTAVYGGNAQFVGSVANWLAGQQTAVVVDAKSMSGVALDVPLSAALGLGILFVLVLPIGAIVAGGIYCLLRRRR